MGGGDKYFLVKEVKERCFLRILLWNHIFLSKKAKFVRKNMKKNQRLTELFFSVYR